MSAQRLKVLSYNVQAGIPMKGAHNYLLSGWRHFIPHRGRLANLKQIVNAIAPYDLVGLQEVDGGSIRSSFVNQIDYLGREGEFLYWTQQNTRNFGRYAQHSNGLLSRYPVHAVRQFRLPTWIPGRGVMTFCLGSPDNPILVVNAHLSLGRRSQALQMSYIAGLIRQYEHVIVMGDFNMSPEQLAQHCLMREKPLVMANFHTRTFPSWRPVRLLDYVLVSTSFKIIDVKVLDLPYSDHLPVSVELELPPEVELNPPALHAEV
jgi:endonuclease/exonuclease/phosphatase family metal-dependent hydrolase